MVHADGVPERAHAFFALAGLGGGQDCHREYVQRVIERPLPGGVRNGGDHSALPGKLSQNENLADAREEGNREKRGNIEDPEPTRGRLFNTNIFHIVWAIGEVELADSSRA